MSIGPVRQASSSQPGARTAPLRVLFFTPTLGSGGAEMQVLRLVSQLDRRFVRPLLSVARAGGSYEARLPGDVALHVCTQRVKSSLLSSAASVLPLRRLILREQPHVVASFIEHASCSLRCAIVGMRPGPKLVLGIQNNFSVRMQHAPLHERTLLRRLYLATYERADRIVALSHGVADDLVRELPSSVGRISVVYNAGMDSKLEAMAAEPLDCERPDGPVIVACGRLTEQKDFATLIRAFARMKVVPAPALWVLGEGPLEPALRALATSLGVGERVRWLGFRANPFPFMAAADVFALSSRWEGFANVLVEALACGTPVVSTDCPYGPSEILERGRHGILVGVGDAEGMAEALCSVLAQGKSAALADQCRARARVFSADRSALGYLDVLQRVVQGSGGWEPLPCL
jgi:glycosyltransferase involved in cell wall biosynthesis